MRHRSIRFRLAIWYSLALTAGLMLLSLTLWLSMRQLLLRDVRRMLSHQVASAHAFVQDELRDPGVHLAEELAEYSGALTDGACLRVDNAGGAVIFNSNRHFPWPAGAGQVQWNSQPYLVVLSHQDVNGKLWLFQVSASLSEEQALLQRLRLLLLMLVPLVMAVASLGGWWLSRRALAPVDEMTAAAQSISAANLSGRLAVPQTGDELARLAETWNSMLARLEDSLKRLSRFTADASHELRTPLAIIRTTAELATRRPRPAEVYSEALHQIAAESERMTGLLEDLLLLARVDSEVVEMPQSPFDLLPLVDTLCSQIRPLAFARQLQVHFERLPGAALIQGNEAAIRRLIVSLLDNAVKYSRPYSEIRVVVKSAMNQICLEVIDSGPGISASELPRIFERFYRGAQARDSAHEGSGLGLSLAAGLAERNQAHIEVSSLAGQGSTFRVSFQLAAA